MTPPEIGQAGLRLLIDILHEIYSDQSEPTDVRSAFIYRHARNISDIADDAFFLFDHGRYTAAGIATRSMLESTFCLVAAIYKESFAVEKVIAECEKLSLKISQHMNDRGTMDDSIKLYSDLVAKLRSEHNVTSRNEWSTYSVAKTAKLENLYSQYIWLCNYVHATVSGIVSQEHEVGVSQVVRCAVGNVVIASTVLANMVKMNNSDKYGTRANELLNALNQADFGYLDRN